MATVVVGVDIGGTNVVSGLVDEGGRVLGRDSRPIRATLDARPATAETMVDQIASSIVGAVEVGGRSMDDAAAIGLGSPGPLDPVEGVIYNPANVPEFENLPLRKLVRDHLGVPVFLDNDANLVALGENWLGAGRGSRHFMCVTLGTGIGGGIVSDGRLLRGKGGNAAEIGHVSIDHSGPRCDCGNYGCLELYASSSGVVRRTRERIRAATTPTGLRDSVALTSEAIFEAAGAGDPLAREIFEGTGFLLGCGIVSAVNFLDLEVIVLFGGLARAGDLLYGPIRSTIRERVATGMWENVRVVPAELGDDAALIGGAKLALEGLAGEAPGG